jgi:hypothetical protein
MLRSRSARVAGVSVATLLFCGAIASADPGEDHGHDGIPVPVPTHPLTPPGSSNFTLLDAADKDGTTNSGSVLPTKGGRYLYVQAFYQGGNSFYDFTNPAAPQELGFADLEDDLGGADSWSTYWYNGTVFVNGGLNRRGPTANRGFEAYSIDAKGTRISKERWPWSNPQTQEAWQAPDDDDPHGSRR